MEAQSTLVRANGTVELHAVTQVDLDVAVVIHPRHTEGNDALGFYQSFYQFDTFKLRMLVIDLLNGDEYFLDCLQILFLSWVTSLQLAHDVFNLHG